MVGDKSMTQRALSFAVIDDDKTMLLIMAEVLEKADYDVSLYHSAATAVVDIETQAPDCVITDINMAGMNGIDLIETLRDNGEMSRTKFIVVTGEVGKGWQQKAIAAGAHAYLRKPFKPEDMLAVIDKLFPAGT